MTDPVEKETATLIKKATTAVKEKTVTLTLDWKTSEYPVGSKLPEWFLHSKLKDSQRYLPVHLYRELLRQIDEFWIPEFSDPEKFATGKNKSWVDVITYAMKCTIVWNKPWKKEPIILTGKAYSAMSWGTLLSDAVHWNFATLEAKSLRSALRHSYAIFEFPEVDVVDEWIPATINTKETIDGANKVLDSVVAWMETPVARDTTKPVEAPKEPVKKWTVTKAMIKTMFDTKLAELVSQCETVWTPITKVLILQIATEIKLSVGEEYKTTIMEVIAPTLWLYK